MTEPTLSTRLRAIQDELTAINNELLVLQDDARHIGLVPVQLANIQHAMMDNQHAWDELNLVARALELSGAHHKL